MTRDWTYTYKLLLPLITILISVFYSNQHFCILPSGLFEGNIIFHLFFTPEAIRGFFKGVGAVSSACLSDQHPSWVPELV